MLSDESDDGSEKAFGASPGEREATLWTSSSGTKAVRTANRKPRHRPATSRRPARPRLSACNWRGSDSFSGIMFDVKNVSEWRQLLITEVHVAGALRRVRVYTCQGTHTDKAAQWNLVADHHCEESWYEPTRIRFNCDCDGEVEFSPKCDRAGQTCLRPGATCGIYIHSDSPGDDGLRYSSAWRSGPAYDDGLIQISTGRSHTSPTPFVGGWWRSPRCLAGGVSYVVPAATWAPKYHDRAPTEFKKATLALLCAANRPESPLAVLPPELVIKILESLFDASYSAEAFTPPASPPKSRLGRWASAATNMLSNLAL